MGWNSSGKKKCNLVQPLPFQCNLWTSTSWPELELHRAGEVGRQVCHFKNDSFKMNNSTNIDIGFPNKSVGWHDSTSMTKEVDKSPTFGWTSKFNVFQVSERIMCWEVTQRVSSQEITTAMHKQVCLYKYWRVTIICVLTYCQETLSPTLLHIYRQWPKKRRQLL